MNRTFSTRLRKLEAAGRAGRTYFVWTWGKSAAVVESEIAVLNASEADTVVRLTWQGLQERAP
jgi:hypothetical protein